MNQIGEMIKEMAKLWGEFFMDIGKTLFGLVFSFKFLQWILFPLYLLLFFIFVTAASALKYITSHQKDLEKWARTFVGALAFIVMLLWEKLAKGVFEK